MRKLECDFTMRVYCAFNLAWNVLLHTMPRPYSDYLRWRMVYQRLFSLKSHEEKASQLFVCPKLFTGCLAPFGTPVICRLIHYRLDQATGIVILFDHQGYIIMDCILQKPQIQVHEIHVANNSANATVEYLEERLLPAIKSFNEENSRSVQVTSEN